MAQTPVAPNSTAAQVQAQPTFRADEFTDFVGINDSPLTTRVYEDGPFKGAGRTFAPQVFYDLGIRHYRTILKYDLTLPDQPQQVLDAYKRSGVQPMFLIDPGKTGTTADLVALLKGYAPGTIGEIEGPNEVNNKFAPQELNLKYAGRTDEAAGAAYMDDAYRAIKSEKATRDIPVIAYSAIFTDYRLAKGHTGFDYANMHSYQGYDVPSSSLLMNGNRFNNLLPIGATIKPFVPTECGYNVEADVANGTFKTGSLRAQALNIPMLLAEYFRHGIHRAYLFAIRNADGYGLLENDLTTKRPSYFALQNFLAQIKDASWNAKTLQWEGGQGFAPRALRFALEGAPPTVHTLSLQKKSGEHLLLIWNEVKNLDQNAHRDIINAPLPVTLRLQTPVGTSAQVLMQNDRGAYDVTTAPIKNNALALQVPSSVMIVRLQPAPNADKIAPSAPAKLAGTATEGRVNLSWAASNAPDVAGYFVFRNDNCVITTSATRFEESSAWIRPGLGYRYAVQAFDKAGNMSPRSQIVVQTSAKYPDLIVTRLDAPVVKAGDEVRLRAAITNVGNGATPPDTVASVAFHVDGEFVSWSTNDGAPIQPGQTIELEANGGPKGTPLWKATRGAHVLSVQLDDINRIDDETSKTNNFADRSWLIDTPSTGLLDASSAPAPGQVDLTREGTLDWIHWGLGGKDGVTRKANVPRQFSDLGEVGKGYRDATGGFGTSARWSDGAPTKQMNDTHASLWLNNVGYGYEFSVPAALQTRVLRLYVGGIEGARGKFTAKLSDASAPDFVSTTWNGNRAFDWAPIPDGFTSVYEVRFRAAKPNQKLTIQWILDGEPNKFLGQARLQAATLSNATN